MSQFDRVVFMVAGVGIANLIFTAFVTTVILQAIKSQADKPKDQP